MLKPILITAFFTAAAAGSAIAAPNHANRVSPANLASMDLSSRGDFVRRLPARDFVPDKTPTSFTYDLPQPGMVSRVGYQSVADPHPIQGYEVNQATALGFSQPSASVGASVGYRF